MTTTSMASTRRQTESPERANAGPGCDLDATAAAAADLAADSGFAAAHSLRLKQFLDFVLALFFLAASAPLFLLIAALIKLTSPGPVLFVQQRVGQGGHVFPFYKFRTMRHNSDDSVHREFSREFIQGGGTPAPEAATGGNGNGNGHGAQSGGNGRTAPGSNGNGNGQKVYKLTRDPRVTAVGSLLRRTSLDELPQLFNVLRKDMSLVGPRPPVVYELEHYQEWHKRRLAAKPGLTGLWQVSGRSSVPFDEMVLLDLYYIEHRSTAMDLRILAKTLPVMFTGNGAY